MSESFNHELIALIPGLRAFARALTGSSDSADDLVQDTLLKAMAARHQYQPDTNLKAWVATILRNQHLGNMRRHKFRAAPLDAVPEAVWSANSGQDGRNEFRDFIRAYAQLPVQYREVLVLVGANGFSYEDAALICDCPVGTIKSRLNRARQDLRTLIDGGMIDQQRRQARLGVRRLCGRGMHSV